MKSGEKKLGKVDRDNFWIKLEKEFAFSDATIPAEVTLDDKKIMLKSVIFNISKKRGMLSDADKIDIDILTSSVAKKKRETISRIKAEELTYDEAKVEDGKRWLNLNKKGLYERRK